MHARAEACAAAFARAHGRAPWCVVRGARAAASVGGVERALVSAGVRSLPCGVGASARVTPDAP
jgi:hypothetical protein